MTKPPKTCHECGGGGQIRRLTKALDVVFVAWCQACGGTGKVIWTGPKTFQAAEPRVAE